MREWQQTKFKDYVMPEAVYYQSLWAVRDLARMESRLDEINSDILEGGKKGGGVVRDGHVDYGSNRPTENKAMEKAILEERVTGIREALSLVPENYRAYILSNIVMKNPGKTFPNKLWKIWKQRFLYNVARNLSMM
jgi:hypothetical protein